MQRLVLDWQGRDASGIAFDFLQTSKAGANEDELFNDGNSSLGFTGAGATAYQAGVVYAAFGGSAGNSLVSIDVAAASPVPSEVVADVITDVIRTTPDGSVVAYLDGTRGLGDEIIVVNAEGDLLGSVTTTAGVTDFDVAADGQSLVYVTAASPEIEIVDLQGGVLDTVDLSAEVDGIARLSWNSESGAIALIEDDSATLSAAAELWYFDGAEALQLTNDAFAQDAPLLSADGTSVYYASAVTVGATERWYGQCLEY